MRATLALVFTFLLIGAVAAQNAPVTPVVKAPVGETPIRDPKALIAALDDYAQRRFLRIDSGQGPESRFHMDNTPHRSVRLDTARDGRRSVETLPVGDDIELRLLAQIANSGFAYAFGYRKPPAPASEVIGENERRYGRYIFGLAGALTWKVGDVRHRVSRGSAFPDDLALDVERRLSQRPDASTDFTFRDWQVGIRPVRAKSECLSCHPKAKVGDPLCVMVYAVEAKPADAKPTVPPAALR